MADKIWQSMKYTPFNKGTKAKSFTPKPNEPASKSHLSRLRDTFKSK